eukprot:TRINITY_DN506_c0_g1_i3.p1 TRINITY_DN506_c0_g1~~TRINITY_DN506_c0_g1_i3.p1  ORF type:complete len:164 (+),score=39.18 TRINITY_DN506_c0_g1_i3:343-834(+)
MVPQAAVDQTALETDLLRRTLIDLLVENEQLRTALQVHRPPSPQPAAVEVPVEPSLASRGHYSTQARKAAVQRFLAKKRRRLANQTKNGPRYTKMKAVADGKQRNSSGKFVKRPILEAADYAMLNPAPVKVETAISLQAAPGAGLPQIFAVTIAAPDESELVA